jgi:guanine deaminase
MQPSPNPEFMRKAIALATENVRSGQGGPFGAVIVKDGALIGEGINCVTRDNDPTAHAEVRAIRAACQTLGIFSLQGCEIYTSCEPCPMCLAAIYWARIDRIWYGNTSADAARVAFDDAFLHRETGAARCINAPSPRPCCCTSWPGSPSSSGSIAPTRSPIRQVLIACRPLAPLHPSVPCIF